MKLLLISGHGAGDPGAVSGAWKEADETRKVTQALKEALDGYCDVAIYPVDRNAYTDYRSGQLNVTAQFTKYDYVLEIHFNAVSQSGADGKTKGVECYVPTTESRVSLSADLCGAVAKAGFTNRGVKFKNYGVISTARRAGVLAMLLEVCFIDDPDDMQLYTSKFDDIIQTIANAIIQEYGLEKEGSSVSYEEFKAYMKRYEEEKAAMPPGAWSEDDRKWLESTGIMTGGRYQSNNTREESGAMMHRLYDHIMNRFSSVK